MGERVRYERQGPVATLVMDDGKANIMSEGMLGEINAALDRAEAERAIVVLRSGLPGVFSAGFDLKVFAAGNVEASLSMVKAGAELAVRLMGYPFPTLGVMTGHAYPMGAFLLLACDLRIAVAHDASIGLNEVAIGIAPPGFAIELARSRLHPSWLSRTVTLGEMYEPVDAMAAGFIDHVAAPEHLEIAVAEALARFAAVSVPAHTEAKAALRKMTLASMREAIDRELTLSAYKARVAEREAPRT